MGTSYYLLCHARREILEVGKAYSLLCPDHRAGPDVAPLLPRDDDGDIDLDGALLTAAHIRAAAWLAWAAADARPSLHPSGWLGNLDRILAWLGDDSATLVSEHHDVPFSGIGWRRRDMAGGVHHHCGVCRKLDAECACVDNPYVDYIDDYAGDECPGASCPALAVPAWRADDHETRAAFINGLQPIGRKLPGL